VHRLLAAGRESRGQFGGKIVLKTGDRLLELCRDAGRRVQLESQRLVVSFQFCLSNSKLLDFDLAVRQLLVKIANFLILALDVYLQAVHLLSAGELDLLKLLLRISQLAFGDDAPV
jgi:hypothetical protein